MKTALITGASKGIGAAIAKRLSEIGYFVIINYNNSEEKAKELSDSIPNSTTYKCDVTNYDDVANMFEFINKNYNSLDVVINNAGVSLSGLLQDYSKNDIEKCISSNLISTIYITQKAANIMLKQHSGNIINISSIWGVAGASCESVYSATKGGIIAFTKATAKEFALSNIRVNSISPGVIKTDMLNEFSTEDLKVLADETPLQRIGNAEDIANMVEFLVSDKASFITGQNIIVDGGLIL